jgi:hypothetical protein
MATNEGHRVVPSWGDGRKSFYGEGTRIYDFRGEPILNQNGNIITSPKEGVVVHHGDYDDPINHPPIIMTGPFKHSRMHSKTKKNTIYALSFMPDGRVKLDGIHHGYFKRGLQHGPGTQVTRDNTALRKSIGHWKKGKAHGIFKEISRTNLKPTLTTKKVVKYRHGTPHGLAYDLPTQHQPIPQEMYYHRLSNTPNDPIKKHEYDKIESLLMCANGDDAVHAIYNELKRRGSTGFKIEENGFGFKKVKRNVMPIDSKFNEDENEDFIGFVENLRVDESESGQKAMYETNDIEHPWKPYDFEPKINETRLTPLQKINYMRCIYNLPLHPDTPPRALSSSSSSSSGSMSDEGGRRRRRSTNRKGNKDNKGNKWNKTRRQMR